MRSPTKIMLGTLLLLLVVVAACGSPALAAELLVPGATIEDYVTDIPGCGQISFDPSGVLYTGRGGSSTGKDKIYRIQAGGTAFREYGKAKIADPDTVVFDPKGAISGTPGSVLVGGKSSGISAVLPNESVVQIFNNSQAGSNPSGMEFDSTGRLVITNQSGRNVRITNGDEPTELYRGKYNGGRLAIDSSDNIYTLGKGSSGTISKYASNGDPIAPDFVSDLGGWGPLEFAEGDLWGTDLYTIKDSTGELLRIDPSGNTRVVGTNFPTSGVSMAFGPDKHLYVSMRGKQKIIRISPVPEPSTLSLSICGVLAVILTMRRRLCNL